VAARIDRAALRAHAATYAATNAALVGTWALTGADEFWPAWSILPWGAALAGHAWCSRAFRRSIKRLTPGGRSESPRRLAR
jgi:2TM domain